MDSPRGRIVLVKGVFEGAFPMADAVPHLDACLGCLACVTACPSGVRYDRSCSAFRAATRNTGARPMVSRIRRRALLETLPYPRRLSARRRASAGWPGPRAA